MSPISLHSAQLESESAKFHALFEEPESEKNWNKFDNALLRMTDITLGSWEVVGFVTIVRQSWKFGISNCLNSDRTKLVKDCLRLLDTLSSCLKERFDESLLIPVLKLCGKANKVIVNCASSTLINCIQNANGFPALIPHFIDAHKNHSKTFRIAAIDCLVVTIECSLKVKLENYVDKLEFGIGVFILDSVPQVRESARLCYSAYQEKFNSDRLLASLPETSKKYLKIEEKPLSWKTPKRNQSEQEIQSKPSSISRSTKIIKTLSSPDIIVKSEKTVAKNPSLGEIGSARMTTNLFSKRFKDNVSKKTDAKEPILGGAMRVLREPVALTSSNDMIHKPIIKALRVPAQSLAAVEVLTKQAINTNIETSSIPLQAHEVPEKKPVIKRKVVVAEFVKTTKTEILPDLNTLCSRSKSSDWQTRCKAFESLLKMIKSKDFKVSPKFTEMIFMGLDDTHFRVVNSVFEVITSLVDLNHHIEPFFVKTVHAVYNSYNLKSRQSNIEQYEILLQRMATLMQENAIPVLLNLMIEPGLMRKPKAKNGLLSMLCLVRVDFLSSYTSKVGNFKMLLLRVIIMIQEVEECPKNQIKELIKALYLSHSDNFWLIWNGLKVPDQNRINKLFGNNISEHRYLLGEMHETRNIVLKTTDSPHSRIPVMHAPPSMTSTFKIATPLATKTETAQFSVDQKSLVDQKSDLGDEGADLSEKTLQDEFEESSDEHSLSKDSIILSDQRNVELIEEVISNAYSKGEFHDEPAQFDHNKVLNNGPSNQIDESNHETLKSQDYISTEENDDLLSEFIDDILDRVVLESCEPEDSKILEYINAILSELVKELHDPIDSKKQITDQSKETVSPILEIAPSAESSTQWHIPSDLTPTKQETSIPLALEPWYIPSWSKESTSTVSLDNLPDILSTLKLSNNEDELHSCFILLQSLLESYDVDLFCSEILSTLLDNPTLLSLPDLDLKDTILSNFPQYFSPQCLLSSLENNCPKSLRVCLSILNDLLSIDSHASVLLQNHYQWKNFLIQGLLSNRSATRHASIKLFQNLLTVLEEEECQFLWKELELSCKSGSVVALIKSMVK